MSILDWLAVVIPDLVMNHWYEAMLHNNRGTFLRTLGGETTQVASKTAASG